MSICRRFYALALLSLLLCGCFLGYGGVVGETYCYTGDGATSFPMYWHSDSEPYVIIRRTFDDVVSQGTRAELVTGQNAYLSSTSAFSGVQYIALAEIGSQLDFNYVPDVYDYYFLVTVIGSTASPSDFTFKPNVLRLYTVPDGDTVTTSYACTGVDVFSHNDVDSRGFSILGKFPAWDATLVSGFILHGPAGSIPANLRYEGLIVAVPVGSDESAVLSAILSELQRQSSTLGQMQGSLSGIQDDINQWTELPSGGSSGVTGALDDFVTDAQNQLNDSMGVLAFADSVMFQLTDCFNPANAGSATLTLPGFSIPVDGVSYEVWSDIEYDLVSLEDHFGAFLTLIRGFFVALSWMAVVNWLFKEYQHFFREGP